VAVIHYKSPRGDITIINGDFLAMDLISKGSIDLIVTEPPYRPPYDEHLKFTEAWLRKALEVAKPDGRLCIVLPFDLSEGEDVKSMFADTVAVAKRVGWKYFATILWSTGKQQKSAAEVDVDAVKIVMPVKAIIVMYKTVWRKLRDGVSDIERLEFIEWTNGLWKYNSPGDQASVELARRCIKLFSYVGSIVLDPFMGHGATCVAASSLRRKCIGVDVDREKCEVAKNRILKGDGLSQF